MQINNGKLSCARQVSTQHLDERCDSTDINLLVVHNIPLPPNQFGGPYIEQLFKGTLKPDDDPFFEQIYQLRVSAHCLIRRDGEIVQFVPFDKRAWHAGLSSFQGRAKCNDFSIGIEMEGADHIPYTDEQYQSLLSVSEAIMQAYPKINLSRVVGHQDIAPFRKTDPGVSFDWSRYRVQLGLALKQLQSLKGNP